MADAVAEALVDRGACFLRHHGLLAIGADLLRAYQAASVTEGPHVYLRARACGPCRSCRRRRSAGSRRVAIAVKLPVEAPHA